MKVVLSWLREFCPVELQAEELAEALTAVGVKVEEVLRPWEGLDGVVAARVIEVGDHPDSDKLCVARVGTGAAEATVVVGVRNIKAGDLVPYAPPGARVPILPEPLGAKKLRGVESQGMLCSPRELNVADVHTGIMILPEDTPLGTDVGGHFGLEDAVLDIEIEPNRPDLMSVIGVAREAAALTGTPLQMREAEIQDSDENAGEAAAVEVQDPERCPHYLARVIRGVTVGASPIAAQARLTASGMRPISNVVDATNYALLEMGHPLHPFDLPLLEGATIVVRRAAEGEKLTTLDGEERMLSAEDLVIADRARGVAIAGVMGSANAEVSNGTEEVLLESAYFERTGILRTARRLGLQTEASMRFERGADPEAVPRAAARAAELIVRWSGGVILAGVAEQGGISERRRIVVRPDRAAEILGEEVGAGEIERRLNALFFSTTRENGTIAAEIPGFRVDMEREIDLVEEIARANRGYERVASSLPAVRQAGGMPPEYSFRRRLCELLVREGYREIRSFSFASQADLDLMEDSPERAVRIANPLSAEEGFLRTRLSPGLLRALRHNRARLVDSAALFEVGTVFRAGDPVEELQKAGFALTGQASEGWAEETREFDFFDAKGTLEALLEGLGVEDHRLGAAAPMPFHPGRSAEIEVAGHHAGTIGEIHPSVAERFDLDGRVAVCVLSFAELQAGAMQGNAFHGVSRFPPARRDLAFIVDESAPAGDVHESLTGAAGELFGSAVLFDVFSGEPVPAGKRSLAFAVEFRAPDRTLTDEEVDAAVAEIAARLVADFGAQLRTG
ncbi:MAG: phenylalanine--tRNA ligase subunit beta [Actinomycetota bacterium]